MSPTARTVFRAVVLSLAALVLVVVGVGLLLADSWQVQTSRVVAAPPARVTTLLSDLTTWGTWAAWDVGLGPQTQRTVDGAPGAAGQRIVWSGPHGRWELVVTDLADGALDYTFARVPGPGESTPAGTNGGRVQWAAEGDGTRVTWIDRGTWGNVVLRWFGWFGAVQDRVQQMQGSSLVGLAQAAERAAAK